MSISLPFNANKRGIRGLNPDLDILKCHFQLKYARGDELLHYFLLIPIVS